MSVAELLKQEMATRKTENQRALDEIGGRMRGNKASGYEPQPSTSGTIRVRRKDNGQTGSMPAGNFDPAKYDKL